MRMDSAIEVLLMEIAIGLSFSDLIKGILQFGIRKNIKWLMYMVKLSKRAGRVKIIPPALIAKGIDVDNDGKYEGFEVDLKSGIISEATISSFELFIEDEKIDSDKIEFYVDNNVIKASKISQRNPLTLLPGMPLKIRVLTSKKLKKRFSVFFRIKVPMVSSPTGAIFVVKLR